MNAPKIISIGEVLWDMFPDSERFGGAPANFACHAALAGGDIAMLSAVGDDSHGHEALKILDGYGIDTRLMQVDPSASTGTVGVVLDRCGKPTYTIAEGTAWDSIRWNDGIDERIRQADAVYFGTLAQRSETSRKTIRHCVGVARDHRVLRILDINLRPPFFDVEVIRRSIELANVLKLSDDELADVSAACGIAAQNDEDILFELCQRGSLDLVVMTQGAEGATLVSQEGIVNQPGIPAEVRDTVGAGDAFTATFVLGLLAGTKHETLLRKSCENASAVCGIPSAVPPMRTDNRIESR